MLQAPSYKILSQELSLSADENENEFSLSLSSDGSQDSLDLVLVEIGNKKRTKTVRRKKYHRTKKMNRIDGFESYEELIGSAKRRKQFIILGGLCLLAVLIIVAIVVSLVLVNKRSNDDSLEEVDLDDILKSKLQPRRFNGTWIDDKSFYYFDELGDFIIYDVLSKTKKVAVNHSAPAFEKFFSASSYEFSADGKYILLATEISKLYRHSFLATWYYYNIDEQSITEISLDNNQDKSYRLAKFGPVGSEMIVVDKNNLYYKSTPSATAVPITKDPFDPSSFKLNGVPDWVYEEEIFSSNSATWFSTDGKKVAFIQFDDTHVPTIALSLYGAPGMLKYPHIIPIQYPKAGAPNPTVRLFSVDLANFNSDNLQYITKPADIDVDHLITSVAWANENDLISVWTNRVQNKGLVYKCNNTGCENVLTLDKSDGWIEFYTEPFFNKAGNNMIFIDSNNGYRHIQVLDLNTKRVVSRTSGKFVVTEILKYNKEHDVIIYTANTEEDIKAQHVYAIKNEDSATPVCLTCNLHNDHTYYNAEVSEAGNRLVITSSGPQIPRVDFYTLKVDDNKIELSEHFEIENNNDMKNVLNGKSLPKKLYDKITFDDGTEAYVMMLLPPNLNEDNKYPMLVEVYGGPDSSSVTNRFSIEWGTYLASSLGIVYTKIDGRGSGLRSDEHLHKLYKNLGTVEVEDQIRTVQKLLEKYSYLDESRTGIWGWSYGGYVSGMSLMSDNDVFKCATSVAPVVDWMLYDSIYTERYMLTPELNERAYNVSRMTHFVDNITKYNKQYMLVHGTLDDNVHFQQGMVLARVLERSDIQFKEITYPDEDHSLAGVRPHLYHSLERFFRQCFKLTE
ncbi:hypothetical protein PVAND_002219 [Polypedilum vanderplanki]|uniref:Venom dipeptidyl peptidase 4 n=1 Tax=Polypedilum vanderplanki TaxID=319348 RepID=A0A9J6BQB8_POLVA|nr:hypothetical protein PVAND_002219 [Polypedilum vanderplanki]